MQNYVVNSITREVIYTPPPALEVPQLMADLAGWLREESMETGERPGCFRPCVCTGRGTISSGLFTISEFYDRNRAGILAGVAGRP